MQIHLGREGFYTVKNRKTFFQGRSWLRLLFLLMLSLLLVMLICSSLQLKQKLHPDDPLDVFLNHMNGRVPALMKQYQIPGCSIALVQNGEIVWLEAYGYADLEKGRVLTVDTPMRVQSISKSVTAWGVMKLVEQGAIDLDAPVTQYLKTWSFPGSVYSPESITVRRLLSHTAGLPLGDIFTIYSPGEEMPSLKEKLTLEAVPVREPGTAFSYSNTGYNFLELLIEEVTGRGFSEYMEAEILLPLGMESASFDWDDRAMNPAPPTGYALNGAPAPVYVYPEKASGGLFAPAEDIARFAVSGMIENPVLDGKSMELLYTPVSDKIGIYGLVFDAYGFGHYIEILPNGMRSVSHGGQGSGIMTHFQSVPETGDAIVILTNSQRSWPFISFLLREWARWRGFPSVGMGKIIWGRYGLSVIILLLTSAGFLLLLPVFAAFFRQKVRKRGADFSRIRWGRAFVAFAIIGVLIWSVCQKYLFLTSVFPVLSSWLGMALLFFAVALFFHALLPSVYVRRYDICAGRGRFNP